MCDLCTTTLTHSYLDNLEVPGLNTTLVPVELQHRSESCLAKKSVYEVSADSCVRCFLSNMVEWLVG